MKVFLYEQLTKALLAELASGFYVREQRFLSKRKINTRWNVSDPTAKSALRWIERQKLIEVRPRSGCYVHSRSQKQALLLLHRVKTPKLDPQPGWESKRFQLRGELGEFPAQPKVAVILAALPLAPKRLQPPITGLLLRPFECADAIFEAAQRVQVALEFFIDDGSEEQRRLITRRILEIKPSGVIAFRRLISYLPLQPMLTPLVKANLPVVTVFDDCEGLRVHSINLNNVAIGYDAARRFLKFGHRRLAVMLPDTRGCYFSDRVLGCEQAWREAGLSLKNLRALRLPLKRSGRALLEKFLAKEDLRPTAIFLTVVAHLPLLWQTLKKLKLAVPRDVSIIATAGVKRIPEAPRAVDTVLIDFPQIGKLAFDTLLAVLAGKVVDRSGFAGVRYSPAGTVTKPG